MRRSLLTGTSRRYQLIIGGLRSLLILVLGFALADPRLLAHSDQVNLFFNLDVSESVGNEKQAAVQEFMKTASNGMGKNDQAGVVLFGKHPSLEMSLSSQFEPRAAQSYVNPNFSNIAESLQFAIGKFPTGGKQRIVLMSDGNENMSNALDAAYLAASLGIEIYPLPLTSWFGTGEVFVQTLETPPTVSLETPYQIRVVIMSSQENQGELVVLRNDALLTTQPVTLHAGKNVFMFADTLTESGLYLYKAVLNCPNDVYFQNNEGLSFTRGTRKSQILYLAGGEQAETPLTQALTAQGLQLVSKRLGELGGSLHDLLDYNAIILNNISGQSLPLGFMENLELYVKEMGGGLLMIGGDQSFGAGQYKNTPVENAMPVFMDAPTNMQFSEICLVFVIDKSSSMTTRYDGKSKLEMAKIATFSSIELLNPADSVGVVAFDTEFEWIVPITQAANRQEIADALAQPRESGGTNMYPALESVFRTLKETDAARKHVIILTDGQTDKADFETLVKQMSAADISVSTVAIGKGADQNLLKTIADLGNGRNYYTDDPNAIPNIFTGETKIVTKELITEKTTQPAISAISEIMQGMDQAQLPEIYGQIVTYPKPGANVVINTPYGPLLAAWQYGLGRSVAFTSDLAGRWGKNWVRWDSFGQFAAQMVKWAQRKESPTHYAANIERNGESATFTVDVTDEQHRYLNHLNIHAKVLFPSQKSDMFDLQQIAPGRYQTEFPAEELGEYYVSLFGENDDAASRLEVFGFAVPYTDEFATTEVNTRLLEKIATITHGRMLSLDSVPTDLFTVKSDTVEYGASLWHYATLLFLLLLIVDIAVRKLLKPSYS